LHAEWPHLTKPIGEYPIHIWFGTLSKVCIYATNLIGEVSVVSDLRIITSPTQGILFFSRPFTFNPILSPWVALSTLEWCISIVKTFPWQANVGVWDGKNITSC